MAEKKRCLIVVAEDNRADIVLVEQALKIHGVDCELIILTDGAEAIHYFSGLDLNSGSPVPDLVLLDMHLPKYDGEDVLNALRSTERMARTPVIIMTGSTAPQVETTARKRVALHYFTKPSNWGEFAELGAIVRNLLEGRKAEGL
jgi:two-component system, chemotaxis family, response regulator Rcp1